MADKDKKAPEETVIASLDELAPCLEGVEYATIPGFAPGKTLRIGSLTAGDMLEWTEANDGEAKKTAGLRLICRSLVGPEPGNVRYADDDKNIVYFRTKRYKETERIVKEIIKLNGMNIKQDNEAKKD